MLNIAIDGNVMFEEDVDASMGVAMRDKMLSIKGMALGSDGDRYITEGEGFQLIQVTEKPAQVETVYVFQPRFAPPEYVVKSIYSVIVALSIIWRQIS